MQAEAAWRPVALTLQSEGAQGPCSSLRQDKAGLPTPAKAIVTWTNVPSDFPLHPQIHREVSQMLRSIQAVPGKV